MKTTTEKVLVIRYLDTDGEYVYVAGVNDYENGGLLTYECYDLADAADFQGESDERLLEVCESFQTKNEDKDCEIVRITTKTTVENVMEDNDLFKELRQKTAISKLTENEIKALGIIPIAVYIKTKYHNV